MRGLLTVISVWFVFCAAPSWAQDNAEGLHYFALENKDRGVVERRGTTGGAGIAFSNLFLNSDTRYRIWVLQADSLRIGHVDIETPGSGFEIFIPPIGLLPPPPLDADGDGLSDLGEFVMATDPLEVDSDLDGITDAAEVQQGTSPLDGIIATNGLIASVDTPGTAVDVCARNNAAVVADSGSGVVVFNVFNGMDPRIVARIPTPGDAFRVACGDGFVAAADFQSGISIIDVSDPPAATTNFFVDHFLLGGLAESVAIAGRTIYVGTSTGAVVVLDARTGAEIERVVLGPDAGRVRETLIDGEWLYAVTDSEIFVIPLLSNAFEPVASLPLRIQNDTKRAFIGGGALMIGHRTGFDVYDVTDPFIPAFSLAGDTAQFGWKDVNLNGSGLAVAANSPNSTFDGDHDIWIYAVADPLTTELDAPTLVTVYQTPGVARAVDLFAGLAYVADSNSGLQVISFAERDRFGIPPSISLDTSFDLLGLEVEEGKAVSIRASVADDVQVRTVELWVDDELVETDGSFPFQFIYTTPRIADRASFTLRARAWDTGGNETWTDLYDIALLPDLTPPLIRRTSPRDGAVIGTIAAIRAYATEPLSLSTITSDSFAVVEAGADNIHDTADDIIVVGATFDFVVDQLFAVRDHAAALPPGFYRAQISTAVTDLAGNPLGAPEEWTFRVFDGGVDSDGDGLPDELELALGLNPNDNDSNNNGTFDGDEDFDSDGLTNLGEVLLQRDATNVDTDGDGTLDGAEDIDRDGLIDAAEIAAGTNPFARDTDGDGFVDGDEIDEGSDPREAASTPLDAAVIVVTVFNQVFPAQASVSVTTARNLSYDGQQTNAFGLTTARNQAPPDAVRRATEGAAVVVQNQ